MDLCVQMRFVASVFIPSQELNVCCLDVKLFDAVVSAMETLCATYLQRVHVSATYRVSNCVVRLNAYLYLTICGFLPLPSVSLWNLPNAG